ERGGAVVDVGAELAAFSALGEEGTESLLVPPALGDELLPALALEVAPLANEHGGDVELLGDDAQVRPQRRPDPVDDGPLLGNPVQAGVERRGALARHLPEEVGLRLDVCVERALLDSERLGQVADRGAVIALLGKESSGGAGQLGPAGAHLHSRLTIVRKETCECAMSRHFSSTSRAADRWRRPTGCRTTTGPSS